MKKRISLIAKGKNFVNATIKEKRILRTVEAALDKAEENVELCKEKAEEIVGSFAGQESAEEYNQTVNTFIKNEQDLKAWESSKEAILKLKNLLNEEVEEETTEE